MRRGGIFAKENLRGQGGTVPKENPMCVCAREGGDEGKSEGKVTV